MTRELSASCLTVSDTGTVLPSLVRNLTTFPLWMADISLFLSFFCSMLSFHQFTCKRLCPLYLDQAQADQEHGWTLLLKLLFGPQVTRVPESKTRYIVLFFIQWYRISQLLLLVAQQWRENRIADQHLQFPSHYITSQAWSHLAIFCSDDGPGFAGTLNHPGASSSLPGNWPAHRLKCPTSGFKTCLNKS